MQLVMVRVDVVSFVTTEVFPLSTTVVVTGQIVVEVITVIVVVTGGLPVAHAEAANRANRGRANFMMSELLSDD
jgi:hypothetical protein